MRKKLQIVGIAVFAVFAFGAMVASSAFAAETAQFLLNGEPIPLGGEAHLEILAEGQTLLLEDMGTGVDVVCTPEGLGFVLANGAGEQTTATCSKATSGSCEKAPTVVAVNVPWTTTLVQEGTAFEGRITKGTGGPPGWLVECEILKIKVNDTCTTELGTTLIENEANGLLHVEFMEEVEKARWANCTVGGNLEGLAAGLFWFHDLGTEEGAEELGMIAVSLVAEP